MSKFTVQELAKKQVQFEYMMRSVGIARFHANDQRNEEKSASATSYNSHIINHTVEQLAESIEAFCDHYRNKVGRRPVFLAHLEMLDYKVSSLVALRSVMDLMCIKDMHISNMVLRVGSRIEDQYKFAGLENSAPKYIEKIMDNMAKKGTQSYSHKRRTLDAAAKNSGYQHKAWEKSIVSQLGAFLIDLVANINFNGQPLLTKQVVQVDAKNSEVLLVPSEHTAEWIEKFAEKNEILSPAYAPCVLPPRDWVTPFNGGFHVKEIAETMSLVRGKKKHVEGLTYKQMPKVYETVNALQNVGWSISANVLDVFKGVMECRLPLGIPSFDKIVTRPAPIPEGMEKLTGKALVAAMTEEEKKEFFTWKNDKANNDTNDKIRETELNQITRILHEAKRYEPFDAIYFVYSLDYRSRVYVESSLITPQGGDLQKGLLRFSEGKAIGLKGLYWLAVQGAGVWAAKDENGIALDKKPFVQRVRHVLSTEFCDMVRNIVADPLNNTDWCNADKPWQFLNWCFEWAALCDHYEETGEFRDFVSHLPIAMDGSCSGTQHYAMILKDKVAGELVNLTQNKSPQDIYGATAEGLTKRLLEVIADDEVEMGVKVLASEWLNHSNRSLAKPPVMTLVYGSAAMTCRKTTLEYLADIQNKENAQARAAGRVAKRKYDFESETEAASMVTPLLWDAVGETQQSSKEGMRFIKQVAQFCFKNNIPLQTIAPTGFIMTQEIFQTKASRVQTSLFGDTRITLREETKELDDAKMRSSSAPNFIHLHDASHLLLTSLEHLTNCTYAQNGDLLSCELNGMSLAVIHDSFGTHACDTSKLRRVLGTQLVKMYEENDVLEDLLAHCEDLACKASGIIKPKTGDLCYDEVLKARYKFG